jgi:hypothetical protein
LCGLGYVGPIWIQGLDLIVGFWLLKSTQAVLDSRAFYEMTKEKNKKTKKKKGKEKGRNKINFNRDNGGYKRLLLLFLFLKENGDYSSI